MKSGPPGRFGAPGGLAGADAWETGLAGLLGALGMLLSPTWSTAQSRASIGHPGDLALLWPVGLELDHRVKSDAGVRVSSWASEFAKWLIWLGFSGNGTGTRFFELGRCLHEF